MTSDPQTTVYVDHLCHVQNSIILLRQCQGGQMAVLPRRSFHKRDNNYGYVKLAAGEKFSPLHTLCTYPVPIHFSKSATVPAFCDYRR